MSASKSISQHASDSTTTTSQAALKKRKNCKNVSSASPLASKRSRVQPSSTKMITQPSRASADSACSIDFSCACTPPLQVSSVAKFSPMTQVNYYSIERNDCISSPMKSKMSASKSISQRATSSITTTTSQTALKKRNKSKDVSSSVALLASKRSRVQPSSTKMITAKGRLDFDGSEKTPSDIPTSDENENTTGSPSEDDAFDFDLPNLDCLADFCFSKILSVFCLTWFLTAVAGPSSVTSVKSVTKCIKVFSPAKTVKSNETCDADQVFAEELAFT
ncbi:hypothetical protein Tco_0332383 [Tanacetum coccineum]